MRFLLKILNQITMIHSLNGKNMVRLRIYPFQQLNIIGQPYTL